MRLIDADDAILQIERREKNLVGDLFISVDAMKEFIKNRPTIEPKREWISVADRLPEEEDSTREMVLAVENDKERMVKLWGWDIVVKYPNEFTHWMPLPEPPENE